MIYTFFVVFFNSGDSFLIYLDAYNFDAGSTISGKITFNLNREIPPVTVVMNFEGNETVRKNN